MIPTALSNSTNVTQTAASATIGIASLILEGRALSEDDFIISANGKKHVLLMPPGYNQSMQHNHVALVNITTNPTAELSLPSLAATITTAAAASSVIASNSSSQASSSTVSDPSLQHFQRIRQKLTQLRQSSPSTSRDPFSSSEHKIVVGAAPGSTNSSPDITAENSTSNDEIENEYFSTSRFFPSRKSSTVVWGPGHSGIGFGSSSTSTGGCSSVEISTLSTGSNQINHSPDNNLLHTLQSLATNCLWTTPRSFAKSRDIGDWDLTMVSGSNSAKLTAQSGSSIFNNLNSMSSNDCDNQSKKDVIGSPKQGPHCDHFLKKIGVIGKGKLMEFEEHICDMANLNEICFHWQIHCRQIEVMMSRSDPICIEVYLGPENHEILLEQWIIEKTDMPTSPTMTIQSLCNAIRSQLYFSQITAWTDLIKKLPTTDKEITENTRIKRFGTIGNTSSLSDVCSNVKKPRLDIFYRIKPYDSTASFNAKPNIHNFPNILISESCAIMVCLKSLPRLHGGIPKIGESKIITPTTSVSIDNLAIPSTSHQSNEYSCNSNCNLNFTSCESETQSESNLNHGSEMFLDDRLDIPCQEKGKHKCTYDEEDGGSSDTVGECSGNSSSSGGSADVGDPNNSFNMSHREKQLMKYRKRMMKRDRKKKTVSTINIDQFNTNRARIDANKIIENKTSNSKIMVTKTHSSNCSFGKCKSQVEEIHHLQQPQEFGSINSMRLPLYQTTTTSTAEAVQTQSVEMISIGTQTANFPIAPNCDHCGNKKAFICFNCCDKNMKKPLSVNTPMDYLELENKEYHLMEKYYDHSDSSEPQRKLGKGDLLLQAIQRAPKNKTQDMRNNNNSPNFRSSTITKNGSISADGTGPTSPNDCQLCKRQKTQHHYKSKENPKKDYFTNNNNSLKSCCSRTNNLTLALKNPEKKCTCSPTCLTVRMEEEIDGSTDDIDYVKTISISTLTTPPFTNSNLKFDNENIEKAIEMSSEISSLYDIDAQFKTPKENQFLKSSQQNYISKSANLLQVSCNEKNLKALPKINLTNVFCNQSLPIPINGASNSPDSIKSDISINSVTPDIPVQKSNSAPTLPNSPSLSPRFIKQAAIYKRRSRHLSDRSDRSSLGSDDLSDEDLDSFYPSPTTSPIKSKFFSKLSTFGRRPILGNLEESLLQKRFVPKMQVPGFKVLLGASGAFCPTQLTIPAAAYFYELEGETLSTPYLCEIRLSRKGYTIPRFGTVQATLLNPLGTVVRMFVIPYDFRDMPPMNQTFIRQRILAVDSETINMDEFSINNNHTSYSSNRNNKISLINSSNSNNVPHCSKEQLRSLRYSIHLRFQTSRSGRLALHTDIRLLISRRTDCDTAAAHAKGALESPNELRIVTSTPDNPKYSARQDQNSNKI